MKGAISKGTAIKLLDAVQMLCRNSATACVRLENETTSSPILINILDGKLLNVVADELSDQEAMIKAFLSDCWDYEVLPQLYSSEKRIHKDTMAFLMESAIECDRRTAQPLKRATQAVACQDLEDRKVGNRRNQSDLVILPHFAESMASSLDLGELQCIIFEEDSEKVTLVKEESRIVRHIYSDTVLHELITNFQSKVKAQ